MRWRIADVETVADPNVLPMLEPVKPDSRLKDPEKIKASIEEKTNERAERLGLDLYCNRIVALGYLDVGNGGPVCEVARSLDDERVLLSDFWQSYRQHETRMVTFYGLSFDLPVLQARSWLLGVPAPPLNLDRYRTPHVDVFQKLTFNGAVRDCKHGLKFFAQRFGIELHDKVDGSDIAQLVAAGDWESIRAHCISDVGATHMLANRLGLLEIR